MSKLVTVKDLLVQEIKDLFSASGNELLTIMAGASLTRAER